MKNKIMKQLEPFRVPLIILTVFLVIYIILGVVVPKIRQTTTEDSPITGIEASSDKEFDSVDDIAIDQFKVNLVHENGATSSLSTDLVTLDTTTAIPVGKTTTVELSYSGTEDDPLDEPLTCTVEVTVKREKILGIQCGYPSMTNVTAVVYSNGEMCFEGEGDVMVFDEGEAPWLDLDDVTIKAVSFEETVTPTDMNYWFEGMDSLTYCDTIPSSVKTMIRTFSECTGLTTAADWTGCENLLNITECYSDCSALEETSAIPAAVRIAKYTYQNCTSLLATPDMSGANALSNATGMFSGCQNLVEITMPPAVVDMTEMFTGCINLKTMPSLPTTVTNLTSAFSGDVSMTKLSAIPESVTSMSGTFQDCQMISGTATIDANCENYSDMFTGAALATKINLVGNSKMLDVYANTSDTGNIAVNGATPNADITTYEDVFDTE